MGQQIKGVLFDKDGTLFKHDETWLVWAERVIDRLADGDLKLRDRLAERGGYNYQRKSFVANSMIVSGSSEEILEAWAELHPHFGVEEIEALGIDCLQDLPLIPVCELAGMIADLKSMGVAVGCGTNDYEASAREQLSRVGVLQHFDFVCGYDSGYGAKPAPGMLRAFATELGVTEAELVMVGDSSHDLHSGSAAGVAFKVAVLTGPATREDLAHDADVVLESIADLPSWLSSTAQ